MQVLAHLRMAWRIYALMLAVLLALTNALVWRAVETPGELQAQVLDVGKGDAILVRTPDNKVVLLDAGPDASILRALGAALPYGERRIDALIELSALHSAVGGVPEVEERYTIGRFYRAGALQRGDRLALGGGVYVDVLLPDQPRAKVTVLHLYYGATSILINENVPSTFSNWINRLDAADGELLADMTIASGTPAGVYVSNGLSIATR